MNSSVKKIGFILLIIGIAVYIIFFSAADYQDDPDLFLDRKNAYTKNDAIPMEKKFFDEFQAGEYLYKTGRYEDARQHFYNVYHKYPTIPKGQLQLDAQVYMILCDKRIEEQRKNIIPDTKTLIKKYYDTK